MQSLSFFIIWEEVKTIRFPQLTHHLIIIEYFKHQPHTKWMRRNFQCQIKRKKRHAQAIAFKLQSLNVERGDFSWIRIIVFYPDHKTYWILPRPNASQKKLTRKKRLCLSLCEPKKNRNICSFEANRKCLRIFFSHLPSEQIKCKNGSRQLSTFIISIQTKFVELMLYWTHSRQFLFSFSFFLVDNWLLVKAIGNR